MTRFAWLVVGFIGVFLGSFGGFLWVQANRAMSWQSVLLETTESGYGPLHITRQEADAYQAGGVAAVALGAFLVIVALIGVARGK